MIDVLACFEKNWTVSIIMRKSRRIFHLANHYNSDNQKRSVELIKKELPKIIVFD